MAISEGIVGNYMGTIFAFINYSTLMPKFMQSTRLFQYKACIPASISAAEIFGQGRRNDHNMNSILAAEIFCGRDAADKIIY